MKLLAVPGRAFIRLTGADSRQFLQGLITNNIIANTPLPGDKDTDTASSVYAAFLNAQGRVLFDAIIHPMMNATAADQQPQKQLLIDCDQRIRTALIDHLLRYKLRARITIEAESTVDWRCWHAVPPQPQPGTSNSDSIISTLQSPDILYSAPDPRLNSLGRRIITRTNTAPPIPSLLLDNAHGEDGKAYRIHRYLNGIGEGMDDFPVGSLLPQESNFDLLNGIDYKKGCYVGQELVIRTHHRGVVRKRVMPVQLVRQAQLSVAMDSITADATQCYHDPRWNLTAPPPSFSDLELVPVILPGETAAQNPLTGIGGKRPIGKLLSTIDNLGLALIRLDLLNNNSGGNTDSFGGSGNMMIKVIGSGDDGVYIKPFQPQWFSEKQQQHNL